MSDLLRLGLSGLQTAQGGLQVTGHNIANVNTPGYSSQRMLQGTNFPDRSGGNYYGTGTVIVDIQRRFDQFTHAELITTNSLNGHAEKMATNLGKLDELLSSQGEVLATSMADLFSAAHAVADQPSDLGIRGIFLEQASSMTNIFNQLDSRLVDQERFVEQDLAGTTDRINKIAESLANLNDQIAAMTKGSQPPNDLIDKRNQLLTELSDYTRVQTVERADGTVDVSIGDGRSFVTSGVFNTLELVAGNPDASRSELTLKAGNQSVSLDGRNFGGSLAGIFEFRDTVLRPARQQLGTAALAMSDQFNRLQAQGIDLNGKTGNPIFRDINDAEQMHNRSVPYDKHTTAKLAVEIADIGKLPPGDIDVTWRAGSPGQFEYTDADGNALDPAAFGLNISYETSSPFTPPADGEKFLIRPSLGGATDMRMEMDDPKQVAAAALAPITPGTGNTSSATLDEVEITTPPPAIPEKLQIVHNAGGYDLVDMTDPDNPTTLESGITPDAQGRIQFAGFSVAASGTPDDGDRFDLDLSFGAGDNRNMLDMANLEHTKVLNGGKLSISAHYSNLVSNTGSQAGIARARHDATHTMVEQLENRVLATSGVNLDEEAANMLNYQQSYQAASKVVSVANDIFQTLINAVS